MLNVVDLAYMALATQPTLWRDVDSFVKGPSLEMVVLRVLKKVMAKEEQCSDWSQELTSSQLACEYSLLVLKSTSTLSLQIARAMLKQD